MWDRGPNPDDATSSAPTPRPARQPILPPAVPSAARARPRRAARRRATGAAAVAVATGAVALVWTLGVPGGNDGETAVADRTATPVIPVGLPDPSTTTTVAAIARSTPAPTTTSASPTSTSPTTSSTSTTTSTSSTTVPEPATPAGPRVAIVGHIGPCSFGDDCLIADFAVLGFDAPTREFVCEFADGSRYTFRFDGDGADRACATSAADGAITIEVDGVRSETITR